ncbi:MAG: flagellar export protein FliJ [Gammaproteobacteria bacterium]|nr:flagellar export protein FliJ [Gammaproteobacteria bacterium]
MTVVRSAVESTERREAERLAGCERRLGECEAKLEELRRYHAEYELALRQRGREGMNAAAARDYKVFLARLIAAIDQQTRLLARVRAERDAMHAQWRTAARRSHSVGELVTRWRDDERRTLERRDQRESDDRGQRNRSQGELPER